MATISATLAARRRPARDAREPGSGGDETPVADEALTGLRLPDLAQHRAASAHFHPLAPLWDVGRWLNDALAFLVAMHGERY